MRRWNAACWPRVAGVSSNTIGQIEKIQKTAAPELVQAVRAGTISINAAAAIASLPSTEQVAAVAGGRRELQQAARQVREQAKEQSRASKQATKPVADVAPDDRDNAIDEVESLRAQAAALRTENAALRQQVAALSAALEIARTAAG